MVHKDPREEIKQLLRAGRLEDVLVRAAALHGHYCPGMAYGVKAGYAGLRRLGFDNTGMEELIAVVECNNCFVDGVQMTTGCTFGNNALLFKDLGKTAVTIVSRKLGQAVRIMLRPRNWDREDASDLEKEASTLAQKLIVERQDDPEASARLAQVWPQMSLLTIAQPEEKLFDIQDAPADLPAYAPLHGSVTCAICGEEFMETRGRLRAGQTVCMSCAGVDCPAVTGHGILLLAEGKMR